MVMEPGEVIMVSLISGLFVSVFLAACTRNAATAAQGDTGGSSASPSGPASSEQSDWSAIEKLEAQAKAMLKVEGCAASADCASSPVGRKACGSPRYYVTYCSRTTDTASLRAKLDAVVKAEAAYNQKYNVMSTCEMRVPPEVELSGGQCRAK